MSDNFQNNKRIARNTLMLYIRMFLVMAVSLYTVRVLLATLGEQDFGLYNVVGGLVVMLSFITQVLSSASQRFFSYEIGRNNLGELNRVFSILIVLYLFVIAVVILISETIGLWFLNTKMTIPDERVYAANIVYQLSILSFCFKIISLPYQGLIIAYEKMSLYAYVSIFEVIAQLVMVLLLQRLGNVDYLIMYGFFVFIIVAITNLLYIIYTKRMFPFIHFKFIYDPVQVKNVVSYSGWTLFGTVASVVRSEGINVILNVYFTPIVNAARGVAINVYSAVSLLFGNFYTAVRPQIIKYYAQEDKDSCFNLVFSSTKFSYILVLITSVPIFCYTSEILNLWLGNYPDSADIFVKLLIITALIDSTANPLGTYNQATGNIKVFQVVIGVILVLNLPISIIVFELGGQAVYAFFVGIFISLMAAIFRLVILTYQHQFPCRRYVKKVLIPLSSVTIVSTLLIYLYMNYVPSSETILGLVFNVLAIIIIVLISSLLFGVNRIERRYILSFLKRNKNE